jgi:hypothetical protein
LLGLRERHDAKRRGNAERCGKEVSRFDHGVTPALYGCCRSEKDEETLAKIAKIAKVGTRIFCTLNSSGLIPF